MTTPCYVDFLVVQLAVRWRRAAARYALKPGGSIGGRGSGRVLLRQCSSAGGSSRQRKSLPPALLCSGRGGELVDNPAALACAYCLGGARVRVELYCVAAAAEVAEEDRGGLCIAARSRPNQN